MSFEEGQSYIIPFGADQRDVLFMVTRVPKSGKPTLLGHLGYATIKIEASVTEPPEGWELIENEAACAVLREAFVG
jgi:hypothetical protein